MEREARDAGRKIGEERDWKSTVDQNSSSLRASGVITVLADHEERDSMRRYRARVYMYASLPVAVPVDMIWPVTEEMTLAGADSDARRR